MNRAMCSPWGLALAFVFLGAVGLRPAGSGEGAVDWTVLFYMAGDNNLEKEMLRDLDRLESAIPEKGIEILVLLDRARGYARTHGDWTETRLYRVRPGKTEGRIESQRLKAYGELNTGDPEVLRRFIAEAIRDYPARHHALFLVDHGGGWSASCVDRQLPGDEKGRDDLTLQELRGALEAGLEDAGLPRFDALVFLECGMAQLEVLAACRDFASVLIASEAPIPGDGMPLAQYVADFAGGEADVRTLARRMVESYGALHAKSGSGPDTTLSAVDATRIGPVMEAFDAFCEKLVPHVDEHWAAFSRALFFAETYAGRLDYRKGTRAEASCDLLDVMTRLRASVKGLDAEREYENLRSAVEAAVIANHVGRNRRHSHGIALYAPVNADCMKEAYGNAAETQGWGWTRFLRKLHARQDHLGRSPQLSKFRLVDARGRPGRELVPLSGAVATFQLEGTNILWLNVESAIRLEDRSYAICWKSFHHAPAFDAWFPVYPDGRYDLGQEVGGVLFLIQAGDQSFPVTVEQTDPSDISHAVVHALLSPPDSKERRRVRIEFDVASWNVASVSGRLELDGGRSVTARLHPSPEARIRVISEAALPNGRIVERVTGTMPWGKEGPRLVLRAMPAGEAALFVRAEGIGGSSAYGMIPFTVVSDPALDAGGPAANAVTTERLAGRWRMEEGTLDRKTGEVAWRDGGARIEIRFPDLAPDRARFVMEEGGVRTEGRVRLDTRGVPLLSLDVRDGGRWVRRDLYVVRPAAGGGRPMIRLRSLGRARGGTRLLRLVPPGPRVEPARLLGTWRDRDGLVYELEDGRYTLREGDRTVEHGTYAVRGDRIVAMAAGGDTSTYTVVSLGEKRIVLEGTDGRTVLTRVER